MFLAVLDDVEAFARELGGRATFSRLAAVPKQIARYGLPTAPPKPGDRRAFNGATCHADAIAPTSPASLVPRSPTAST